MALTSSPLVSPIGAVILKESASGATADTDVRAGATTVYMVDVDNTANGAATFTKLYDSSGPTVGTTAPDYIFKTAASSRKTYVLDLAGVAFTNLSFASLTAGGTAGSTSPTSSCIVRVLCT